MIAGQPQQGEINLPAGDEFSVGNAAYKLKSATKLAYSNWQGQGAALLVTDLLANRNTPSHSLGVVLDETEIPQEVRGYVQGLATSYHTLRNASAETQEAARAMLGKLEQLFEVRVLTAQAV